MSEGKGERWLVGDLTIDVGAQTVTRGDDVIALPQLSFAFLLTLVRAAPNVLSIDNLMELVWPGIFVNSETVTQRAKLLRDALGDNAKDPRYFTVRRGVGYQLVTGAVRLEEPPPPQSVPLQSLPARRPARWKSALGLGAICLVLLGGVAALYLRPHHSEKSAAASATVAVLPFENLSTGSDDSFIAASIPEMVLDRLSSVHGLTVIARESALLSRASARSAKDAGLQLGARYIVKGSVQRMGETLRVTCFVIDTSNEVRLWSERFDWPMDRLYALQDRIADHVAGSLEQRIGGLSDLPRPQAATRNPDAYLAYLQGKSLLGRFTVAETDAAAAQFERAVQLDPEFAAALVALFDAKMQGADLRKDDLGPLRAEYQPLLDKALTLEPNSGAALFAKAMWSDAPRDERVMLFDRAAELDPSNSRGLTAFAEYLEWENVTRDGADVGKSKQLMDRVLSIDPLSARAQFWSVQRQLGKLTPDQLEAAQKGALELDPTNYALANRYATRRWMFHGESAEAIELMEKVIASDPQNPWGPHVAVAFYLDANDPAAARALAATTPGSRDSTRAVLALYSGDWRGAGEAALGRRGFLFNPYTNWIWAEAVRDYVLRTGEYQKGAEAIAARYGFDLANPTVSNLPQAHAAVALGHILLDGNRKEAGTKLLTQTILWVDQHPRYGLVGVGRYRAAAMMLLGQRNEALSELRASFDSHDIRHWWYVVDHDPVWAPVRNDPRFQAIAKLCHAAAAEQHTKLDTLRKAGKVPVRNSPSRS